MFVFSQVLVVPQTQDQLHCRVQIMTALAFQVSDISTHYNRIYADVEILSCCNVVDGCSDYIRSTSSFHFRQRLADGANGLPLYTRLVITLIMHHHRQTLSLL